MTNAQHTPLPCDIKPHTIEALRKAIASAEPQPRTGAAFVNIDTRVLAGLLNGFGPNAIAAAEADLLGEALELLRQHRDYIADTLNGVDLREYGKLVADDLVMVDTLLAKAGRDA